MSSATSRTREAPASLSVTTSFVPPPAPSVLSPLLSFHLFLASYKWNHTTWVLISRLLTQFIVLFCGAVICSFYCHLVFHYITIPQFSYLPTHWYLDCFYYSITTFSYMCTHSRRAHTSRRVSTETRDTGICSASQISPNSCPKLNQCTLPLPVCVSESEFFYISINVWLFFC